MRSRISLHILFTIETERTQQTELMQADEGIKLVVPGVSTS
jgi:hypothetical protein